MTDSYDAGINDPKKIAIIHPDLGIGGAERLIVDIGLGLQQLKKHKITVYTSHCDKSHAFEEVANNELEVVVYGDFLPRKLFGRFTIFCAILRQLYLTIVVLFTQPKYDFFIVDSLAACLPFLWLYNVLFNSKKQHYSVLFYCHFPDLKLAQKSSLIKKLYRLPFDAYEEFCYWFCDQMYVNSKFTKSVFKDTFKILPKTQSHYVEPIVAYPCIDETVDLDKSAETLVEQTFKSRPYFLSVNRFERKKNVQLALEAYVEMDASSRNNTVLVIAGGYDDLVSENVEYLQELCSVAEKHGLSFQVVNDFKSLKYKDLQDVVFLPNISSTLKNSLLNHTALLLYTPSFEHFGIVPIEAMKYGTLVLATNTGGPTETVVPLDDDFTAEKTEKITVTNSKGTGYLKPASPKVWSRVLENVVSFSSEEKTKLRANGPAVVDKLFTRKALTETVNVAIVNCSRTSAGIVFESSQRIVYIFLLMVVLPVGGDYLYRQFR